NFFFQAEDGIRDRNVTGVQTCALPISNATGHRVAVLPLPANDALAVFDADSGVLLKTIPLGVLPVAAVISWDGSVAYVSVMGGRSEERRVGKEGGAGVWRGL